MEQTTQAESPKFPLGKERGVSAAARRFWNWAKDEDSGIRTLYLDGTIAEESWFADDVTPKAFKADLTAGEGDIVKIGRAHV